MTEEKVPGSKYVNVLADNFSSWQHNNNNNNNNNNFINTNLLFCWELRNVKYKYVEIMMMMIIIIIIIQFFIV
jgi:hypothetical protein